MIKFTGFIIAHTDSTDSAGSMWWLSVAGVALIVLGIWFIIKYAKKQKRLLDIGEKITATITSTKKSTAEYGYNNLEVWVSYTVENKEYNNRLEQPIKGEIGDTVKIIVNKQNPNDFMNAESSHKNSGLFVIIVGIAMVVLGIILS